MKKVLDIFYIFIIFLILYFLQANFFTWFTIFSGVKPNLFIILALFLGLFLKRKYGFAIGIILGLILDFFIGRTIGINAISLGIAGLAGELLDKNFTKESRINLMFMIVFTTFVCEFIAYILYLCKGANIEFLYFIKIIIIEMLYNAIISIILYPAIQRFGQKLENDFTLNKTFIKYF